MKGRASAWAPLVLALGLVSLFFGARSCARGSEPQLVQLADVVPRDVEVGDRITVFGSDFPTGRPARVSFRGTLHRPGEPAVRAAGIAASAIAASPQRLEFTFNEAIQAAFAGAGARETHTTFDGDVEVAFIAAAPGAAAVTGHLAHVTLDVRPSPGSARRLEQSGEALLAWLGVRARSGGSGLVVESVEVGSRAEAWGLEEGDVVTSFDGLRVASASDLVPAPGEQTAMVGIRRGGDAETTRPLRLAGLPLPPAAELLPPVATVAMTLIAIGLLGAPSVLFAPWLLGVLWRGGHRQGRSRGPWLAGRPAALPYAGPALILDVLAYASIAVMPFGQYLIAARLDVALLFVGAAASLAVAAFMAARSPWAGLHAAMQVVWQHVPAAAAVASVVAATGSLRIQEINDAQGAFPWQWLAFRHPGAPLALGLLLASGHITPNVAGVPGRLLAESARSRPRPGEAGDVPSAAAGHERSPWIDAARRAHRVVVAGLAGSLFLGGWHLPGVVDAERFARPVMEVAGAAWLIGKAWVLAWTVTSIRSWFPPMNLVERSRAALVWQFPLGVLALVASVAWARWSPTPALQALVSALLLGLAVSVAAAILRWTHRATTSAVVGRHVSTIL